MHRPSDEIFVLWLWSAGSPSKNQSTRTGVVHYNTDTGAIVFFNIKSTMGFFNKLKEQALEKAKEEMMAQLGLGGGGGGEDDKPKQMTKEEFEETKPDELRKDIRMISGCQDT